MALSVNEVFLGGQVGIVKTREKSTTFTLCTTHVNSKGNKVFTWHNVVVTGKLKDWTDKFVKKSKRVWVRGRLTYRQDSAKFCNVYANHVQFTENKKGEEEGTHSAGHLL